MGREGKGVRRKNTKKRESRKRNGGKENKKIKENGR